MNSARWVDSATDLIMQSITAFKNWRKTIEAAGGVDHSSEDGYERAPYGDGHDSLLSPHDCLCAAADRFRKRCEPFTVYMRAFVPRVHSSTRPLCRTCGPPTHDALLACTKIPKCVCVRFILDGQ